TIRRDFSYFGALRKKGYGNKVDYLLEFFKKTLAHDEMTAVDLISVGNLGKGLLNYNLQQRNNTKISMGFDRAQQKVGHVGEVPIYNIDDLEKHLGDVDIAILTVPATEAQDVTDRLVQAGIKGILNFTPARINHPEDIRIHHIDLSVELQSFIYF